MRAGCVRALDLSKMAFNAHEPITYMGCVPLVRHVCTIDAGTLVGWWFQGWTTLIVRKDWMIRNSEGTNLDFLRRFLQYITCLASAPAPRSRWPHPCFGRRRRAWNPPPLPCPRHESPHRFCSSPLAARTCWSFHRLFFFSTLHFPILRSNTVWVSGVGIQILEVF